MKTTPAIWERLQTLTAQSSRPIAPSEPGRLISGKFVPNRIIRGRIVEALREAKKSIGLHIIGRTVCIDWKPREHMEWITAILLKLERDGLILQHRKNRYILSDKS